MLGHHAGKISAGYRGGLRRSPAECIMDVVNVVFLTLIMLICVFPFYYLFINTISDNSLSARGLILLYPRGIHFENYVQVFKKFRASCRLC